MKISLKQKIAAVAAAATIVGGSGIALAYWTTTGGGTGAGSVAAANGALVLHASFDSGIFPGGTKTVTFTADNAGASNLQVGTIHSVVSTSDAACLAADFSIADVLSNTVVLAGATGTSAGTGSLVMANTSANQDACKGATITLTLTS